jgi:nifR3 family TIM-barrel protein
VQLKPLRFGGLEVGFPVVLAPMAGYTDRACRMMCRRFGCELAMTEVANAQGLVHGSKPTFHILETGSGEHPVAAHIYGSDPDVMAEAARRIERLERFDFIDINCGCPVRKIVARGAGVALMKTPARIEAIVAAVRAAVAMPVTIKTRLGLTPETHNVEEVVAAAEAGGAAAVFVHARYASARHSGPADWEALAAVKAAARVPLAGNGGVDEPADALRMLGQTGVDGVMIGRAAIGRPWIFEDVAALAGGEAVPVRSPGFIRDVVSSHLAAVVVLKEREYRIRRHARLTIEHAAVLAFRGHLHQYLAGRPRWARARRRLNDLETRDDVMAVVNSVLSLS